MLLEAIARTSALLCNKEPFRVDAAISFPLIRVFLSFNYKILSAMFNFHFKQGGIGQKIVGGPYLVMVTSLSI